MPGQESVGPVSGRFAGLGRADPSRQHVKRAEEENVRELERREEGDALSLAKQLRVHGNVDKA